MDVVVIGCGASGVAALRRLHDAGLKVLGLEAGSRIGGRICTVPFGANNVDIGAAWCHGEKDNKVFELADPLGLIGRPETPLKNIYVLSNGDILDTAKGVTLAQAIADEVYKADKDNTTSISECVRTAATTNDILKQNRNLAGPFIEWFERNNHLGGQTDPRKGKSLKGLKENWPCEGEVWLDWKGRGYKTIIDVLLNKYPDPSKEIPVQILLNKEVESIRWGSSQTGLDPSNPLVQVKCKDGSLYAAKSVIVTVSIGVLKERHQTLFNPPLPAEKINCINNLQLCLLNKIYIEFEKPWYPKRAYHTILWRDEDKAKFSSDEKWITEIFGLWTVEHQPNVMLAWLYGNGAEMMEKVSLGGVEEGVKKLLSVVFKQFDVTNVKSIVRSQWASNPLARGAYSYRSVVTEENGGSAEILSEPLYRGNQFPVVCFAGEATSHRRHNAVHGALDAGFREADRLLQSFKEYRH
ncbi:peroxisomal N(1)-acetyl-spermine/spermidine oxidase-like isoform X2 [Plodia interpunctella]|nr:peroxisomal N(1)-acetyl-spermine/spermidine oxidase-like isoform X2 [Plodia interpunctella]XP_053612128.1 peroxisomal N(1)-acetyl-spermine/spermidine oxidase-like isoform X2 [Plodia interpunctella]XP_053612129.1 peroxisomal N(1)-acetyl-spermine/spermidine oxidase-like isoform X2 [Plodia interpunctella]XP_053612131.1 peroxisomal N(1)-acetyl-spermine/spermidine oxidase-like isoform X2 [Plodia interpunctella]